MPKDFYADLAKLLRAAGCAPLAGGKGSHEVAQSNQRSHLCRPARPQSSARSQPPGSPTVPAGGAQPGVSSRSTTPVRGLGL